MHTTEIEAVIDWATKFARCVRDRDFEGGQALFSAHVHSFGTRTSEAQNLQDLLKDQWSPTWNRTQGFDYVPGSMHVRMSEDACMAVVMARWSSMAIAIASEDTWNQQVPHRRIGRCSFVLTRIACEQWHCIHSHFSLDPAPSNPT